MKQFILMIVVTVVCSFGQLCSAVAQEPPLLAVAANFRETLEKIAAVYENETGRKLHLVTSSTGKLYAQIKRGAPFDLFFAADAKRPELLAEEGFCETPFVYALGEAVLWTKDVSLAGGRRWQDVVKNGAVKRISLSTPETAPYGAAAMSALSKEGLWQSTKERVVYGQNVAQAFQFAFHGSADLGFTSLSLALSEKGRQGVYLRIPEAEAVVQKGCVVIGGRHSEAREFLDFMRQAQAKKLMDQFGYR